MIGYKFAQRFWIMVESDGIDEKFGELELLGCDSGNLAMVQAEDRALFLKARLGVDRGILQDGQHLFLGQCVHDWKGQILEDSAGEGLFTGSGVEMVGVLPG